MPAGTDGAPRVKPAKSLRPIPPSDGPLAPLLPSWQRHLRAARRSVDTISTYMQAAVRLDRHLTSEGVTDVDKIEKRHLETWLIVLHETGAPASASNRWRGAKQLLKWLVAEGEIQENPAADIGNPTVPDTLPDVLTPAQFSAVLATCDRTFEGLRDRAMLLFFYDNGCRLDGVLGLDVADVDLDEQVAQVVLKGGEELHVPFGAKTAEALDRYLRARRKHRYAHLEALWVHRRGRMSASGIQTMMKRRGARAGVPGLHPHQFRHTFSHLFKDAGGSDGDLMAICGWKSTEMAQRYGRSVAAQRARATHRRLSPADQL